MAASKGCSNLHRFLNSVTPIVPSRTLFLACEHDEMNLHGKLSNDKEGDVGYFKLKDLWNCYEEWSAFGVETRVALKSGETVKQYYIPYLSAVQIYVASSKSPSMLSRSEADVDSESLSDDSRSSEPSRSLSKVSSNTWDSASEDSSHDQGGSWSCRDRFGDIYLEYFETCSMNLRVPFTNKMDELLKNHPELNSLTSLDVSPASWMAVSWYPIYHIPNINDKDLSACFLTYHTLSSIFLDLYALLIVEDDRDELSDEIWLSPYGIAAYKMRGDLWIKSGTAEYAKFVNLQKAATSWLKQLNVYHHDSSFFASRLTV
ncbi:hypothetical protein SAY87_004326 [Trapa incisa]|uniref:Uncharacterized protein n=1 Tax=Trapa incisa TaxID=236973 RepID=A0AAN7PM07_9MYRT|nr:hypothetical protein SAY87_004326 [Trapa incisa]